MLAVRDADGRPPIEQVSEQPVRDGPECTVQQVTQQHRRETRTAAPLNVQERCDNVSGHAVNPLAHQPEQRDEL